MQFWGLARCPATARATSPSSRCSRGLLLLCCGPGPASARRPLFLAETRGAQLPWGLGSAWNLRAVTRRPRAFAEELALCWGTLDRAKPLGLPGRCAFCLWAPAISLPLGFQSSPMMPPVGFPSVEMCPPSRLPARVQVPALKSVSHSASGPRPFRGCRLAFLKVRGLPAGVPELSCRSCPTCRGCTSDVISLSWKSPNSSLLFTQESSRAALQVSLIGCVKCLVSGLLFPLIEPSAWTLCITGAQWMVQSCCVNQSEILKIQSQQVLHISKLAACLPTLVYKLITWKFF